MTASSRATEQKEKKEDQKEKKAPATPPAKELKKEPGTQPSPSKYVGAAKSKKCLYLDNDRKNPAAKKPPGATKVSTSMATAKAVVTGKDLNHASIGHRFRVTAMPTACLQEVCGFPTFPKDAAAN